MGQVINGVWKSDTNRGRDREGRFVRQDTAFRDWLTADGSSGFKAEPGRYHLYVSHACPWAHRTVIVRKLKGLEDKIGLSVVHPLMLDKGWAFGDDPGAIPDTVNGCDYVHQLYIKARPDYTGRASVPVLWDKERGTIVNNESAEIIRMFNGAFGGDGPDFFPPDVRGDIEAINARVYETVNNGVYKAGFATTQAAYEGAFDALFAALDDLEQRLGGRRYLTGERITEADWRLFTTLVRFDAVYYGHFKCNLRRIVDYPNLWAYTRDLYQHPGVAETVNMDHIKRHYHGSHHTINPSGIVPRGPRIDFMAPSPRALPRPAPPLPPVSPDPGR